MRKIFRYQVHMHVAGEVNQPFIFTEYEDLKLLFSVLVFSKQLLVSKGIFYSSSAHIFSLIFFTFLFIFFHFLIYFIMVSSNDLKK